MEASGGEGIPAPQGFDEQFARALAAAGVISAGGIGLDASADDLALHLQWLVQTSRSIVEWEQPPERWHIDSDVAALANAWQTHVCDLARVPRLEVIAGGVGDILSSVEVLSSSGVGAGSVHLLLPASGMEESFGLPLRLGFLEDAASQQFAKDFFARNQQDGVVRVGPAHHADLLVIPHGFRDAILSLQSSPQRSAGCVLILGDLDEPLHIPLMTEVRTAGLAVLRAPAPSYPQLLSTILSELSLGSFLDEALFTSRPPEQPPIMFAARALVEQARMSLVHAAAQGSSSASIRSRDSDLDLLRLRADTDSRDRVDWMRVTPARDLHALIKPRASRQASTPPRHLQADVRDARGLSTTEALVRGEVYSLFVTIAPRPTRMKMAIADTAFDEWLLQPSVRGHDLNVVFSQAPRKGERRRAQVSRLHLPPIGMPEHGCEFTIRAEPGDDAFEARITVLYRNRVLQTARVVARVRNAGESVPLDLRLAVIDVEGADAAATREPFEAALILNDSGFGPSVTSVAGDEAVVTNIGNLKDVAKAISKAITLFTDKDRVGGLTEQERVDLITAVALPGSQLWSYLREGFPKAVLEAKRVQVMEAAIGAMLPVELFYRMPAPAPGAKLCEGGPPDTDRLCSKCPAPSDAPSVACMNQFWGFQTVFERRGLKLDVPLGAVATLKVADGLAAPLRIESAVYGTSDVVDAAVPATASPEQRPSVQARRALEDLVGRDNVLPIDTLDSWAKAVAERSPGLIVFLVHKTEYLTNDALQLGSTYKFAAGNVLEKHVVGPAGTHPIIVLMGCKTRDANADVLGFVPWLTHIGASAVVSTLAPVLGRYAGPALAKLIRILGEKRGKGTLGEAIVEAKRQMVAEGEPIGMCLVTYGEADIRL